VRERSFTSNDYRLLDALNTSVIQPATEKESDENHREFVELLSEVLAKGKSDPFILSGGVLKETE